MVDIDFENLYKGIDEVLDFLNLDYSITLRKIIKVLLLANGYIPLEKLRKKINVRDEIFDYYIKQIILLLSVKDASDVDNVLIKINRPSLLPENIKEKIKRRLEKEN